MRKDILDLTKSAEEDMGLTRYSMEKDLYNQACFHAQQAVEKYLKALNLLIHGRGKSTHNLTELITELPEKYYLFNLNADLLTKYYIGTKHHPLMSVIGEKAGEAMKIAKRVTEFVGERII